MRRQPKTLLEIIDKRLVRLPSGRVIELQTARTPPMPARSIRSNATYCARQSCRSIVAGSIIVARSKKLGVALG
jgi:hypothetical protein